jgi:hypothetical protein
MLTDLGPQARLVSPVANAGASAQRAHHLRWLFGLVLTTRNLALALGLAAIVAAGSGCQQGATPDVASPSSTPAARSSAASPARDEALIAYRGMWSSFVEAAKTSNPDAPDLRLYASDNALTLIVNALYVNREQGVVILGDVALDPTVVAAEPESETTAVTILDCVNSESWLEYWATGGLVDDKPAGRHRTTATVSKDPTGWKVSAFTLRETGTC